MTSICLSFPFQDHLSYELTHYRTINNDTLFEFPGKFLKMLMGVTFSAGVRDFSLLQNLQTDPEDRPYDLQLNWYRSSLPGVKRPGREANYSPTPVPRLRMRGATPLLPPCAFMACTEIILFLSKREETIPQLASTNQGKLKAKYL
jgi:hypothetical protein